MRVVVQRASSASVSIDGQIVGEIGMGLVILVGIEEADSREDVEWLADKVTGLRIFPDEEGKMNRSLVDVEGGLLVVSQFTLHASTKKGKRPSFIRAARPETAVPLYESFLSVLARLCGRPPQTGEFGADMQVSLVNDGPVTIVMDTKNKE